MLRPTDKRLSIFSNGQGTKPRQPSGANTIQPLQNSGQPGTAGLTSPKATNKPYTGLANNTGVNAGWDLDRVYGTPTGSQANAIAAGAAQGFEQRGQAALGDAQKYYSSTRQLAKTGVPDYSDYNMKTAMQNQRVEDGNAAMESAIMHQKAGGGLKASNRDLANYGGPLERELATRDAGAINALAASEQAKKDAFNEQYDQAMERYLNSPTRQDGYVPQNRSEDLRYSRRTAAQEEGLARRQQAAAKQSADSAAIAGLIARGLDPYAARNAVATDNHRADLYNFEAYKKQQALDAEKDIARTRAMADIYGYDRQLEAAKLKQDPYQNPGSQLASDVAKQGGIDLSSTTAPASVIAQAEQRGLSPADTVHALSKTFGVDLQQPQNAMDFLRNLAADMRSRIESTQTADAWTGESGWNQAAMEREYGNLLKQHLPTIRLLRGLVPAEDFEQLWKSTPDDRVDLRGVMDALAE